MNNNNNNNNEYTQMQMNVVRSPVCYIPQQFVVVCGGGWKRLLCDVCVCVFRLAAGFMVTTWTETCTVLLSSVGVCG